MLRSAVGFTWCSVGTKGTKLQLLPKTSTLKVSQSPQTHVSMSNFKIEASKLKKELDRRRFQFLNYSY